MKALLRWYKCLVLLWKYAIVKVTFWPFWKRKLPSFRKPLFNWCHAPRNISCSAIIIIQSSLQKKMTFLTWASVIMGQWVVQDMRIFVSWFVWDADNVRLDQRSDCTLSFLCDKKIKRPLIKLLCLSHACTIF